MVFLTSRFVQLFLFMFAMGAFDGSPWMQNGPGVSAAPTGSGTAARIGIKLNDDASDSTAASSVAPSRRGSSFSIPPSRRGSSFEDYDLAKGNKDAFTLPLEHVDRRDPSVHPMMLFQHHLNRANVKLAKMSKRAPPTADELARALFDRRRSIDEAYGGREEVLIDPRDSLPSQGRRSFSVASVKLPSSHGRIGLKVDTREALAEKRQSFSAASVKLPSSHGRIGIVLSRDVDREVSSARRASQAKRLVSGVFEGEGGTDSSASSTTTATTATTEGAAGDAAVEAASSSSSSSSSTDDSTAETIAKAKSQASQLAYSDTLTSAAAVTAANSAGLAIEANNIGYVATIQVGAQKTPFKMLIDSGSADTWVPSSKCTNCGTKQQKLGTKVSNTLKTSQQSWSITYGTGKAKGILATDDFSIAGLSLKQYKFALATSESDDFSSSPFDGLMGLAQQKLANSKSPTPIDAMYNNKLVSAPVMGYKLGDATAKYASGKQQDGQVTFGGVDSSKYTGALVEIPNVSSLGFYEIPIQGVSVNGKKIAKLSTGRTSILDTGTSLMVAPQADAEAVHAQIPGSRSDGQGGFTIPCTSTATLSFTFGGQEWPLLARDMIFVPLDASKPNGDCISSLGGGNIGGQNEWLVGAAALKRLYFATNASKNVIGLCKLRNPVK